MEKQTARILGLVMSIGVGAVGCGESEHPHGNDSAKGGHVHVAPHGGTLTEIGSHAFNVEWVRDGQQGVLDAYILDGHAENYVRISQPAFTVMVVGQSAPLKLEAVASSQTGEKVGDSARFRAQVEWLKGTNALQGELKGLELRGQTFDGIRFSIPR